MTDPARTFIAIIVAPEGSTDLWIVHLEDRPEPQIVVFSDMPTGYSFAPGSRVTVREVIPAQKYSIVGLAPATKPAIEITVGFAPPSAPGEKKK